MTQYDSHAHRVAATKFDTMASSTTDVPGDESNADLLGSKYVTFLGKLGAVPKRSAVQVVREHGGQTVDLADDRLNLIVVGADELPIADDEIPQDRRLQELAGDGQVEIISETEFWHRLGLIDEETLEDRLYTPAMLAELLGVPLPIIRRWARRGLIVPAREVHRLPYFEFQEVSTARNLAKLLAAGASPNAIEKKLARLSRFLPNVERPLAQLSVIIEGRQLLLRQGEGLLEPGGQLRFDFEALEGTNDHEDSGPPSLRIGEFQAATQELATPEEMVELAMLCEDEGRLEDAVDAYRAALAAGGLVASTCFQLAELLYRLGDSAGARERYYNVIEIDDQYVEARHNLGCLLAEQGQFELAAAAFEGALTIHGDYPDAHYHLAQTLDELFRMDEAEVHWRTFIELAADSPWADQARNRLKKHRVPCDGGPVD